MSVNINRWDGAKLTSSPKELTCWNCGTNAGGQWGYGFLREEYNRKGIHEAERYIYICPKCASPVYFPNSESDDYVPRPIPGRNVASISDDVDSLYTEMRKCIGATAYTAAVLLGRKILMHVAVDFGAKTGLKYFQYVKYLYDNQYISQKAKGWVDHIRGKGNEANHEIVLMTKEESMLLLQFIEMLLKTNYELPASLVTETTNAVLTDD